MLIYSIAIFIDKVSVFSKLCTWYFFQSIILVCTIVDSECYISNNLTASHDTIYLSNVRIVTTCSLIIIL